VELTEVYRQALESPIIALAHRILSGNPLPADQFPQWKVPGKLTIHPWKKKIEATTTKAEAKKVWQEAIKVCDELRDLPRAEALKTVLLAHGDFIDHAAKGEGKP